MEVTLMEIWPRGQTRAPYSQGFRWQWKVHAPSLQASAFSKGCGTPRPYNIHDVALTPVSQMARAN